MSMGKLATKASPYGIIHKNVICNLKLKTGGNPINKMSSKDIKKFQNSTWCITSDKSKQ
jgi:hypothetical protein